MFRYIIIGLFASMFLLNLFLRLVGNARGGKLKELTLGFRIIEISSCICLCINIFIYFIVDN